MTQPDTHATGVFNADARGVHYDFLKDRVPAWFNQASTQRQVELATHELHQLPDWYRAASPDAKAVLADSHTAYREAANSVEDTLGSIVDIAQFAEALLKHAIKQAFNLDLDVRNVFYARKYRYQSGRSDLYGFFAVEQQSGSALNDRYRGISLLEAALANFEPDEEQPLSCDDCHLITTFGAYDGEIIPTPYAVISQALAIAPYAFAKLCRWLDLGGRYQKHLESVLRPEDPVKRKALEQQLQEHHRQQLAVSVEIAHLQASISDDVYAMLKQVLADTPGVTLDARPVGFARLKLYGSELVGPLLIGASRENMHHAERLVVFIPNDPQQPLKEYASSHDFRVDLRARLHSASYRRFFSRFVPQREQGAFFKQFNRAYQPSGNDDATLDYPLQANPALLRLMSTRISGVLWEQLAQASVNKIFSDSRAVAVPTGDEDIKARNERLQSYRDAVLSFLNVAAFIVPGLGPIMLAVGAAQMCYEVYEGIDAAGHGDTKAMWAHFSSVALNAAFLATGAKVLPGIKSVNMLDHLRPVTMPSGKQLLWTPDLSPYESALKPAPDAKADPLGLHQHEDQTVLPLEGKHYQVRQEADTGQYRIQHPTRPHAYAPKLEHNHAGAWSHELEEPLTWDEPTLLKRLGLAERADPVRISGVEADTLRETFIDREPVPLMLDETLKRFEIHQALTTFVEQMNSTDPRVYAKADAALQLDTLQRRGMLPDTPQLRVLDPSANVLWESPGPASAERKVVALSQGNMDRGELLNVVLQTLQAADPALTEIPGSPTDALHTRASLLRQDIGKRVESIKRALVDQRYKAATRVDDPDVLRVTGAYPTLSGHVAAHLLETLGAEDLALFRSTGRLPHPQAEQAQWYQQEARVSRAYEGLHLDTLTDIDSQRLALRTLETLPGWPPGTRLELRQYSAGGPLLDAIGSPNGAPAKTLVLQENGAFSTQGAGDFYTATWEALSPAEQQALGLNDAAQLKQAVVQSPLPRSELRSVLLEHPVRKPAYDPSMRLLGGGPGVRQLLAKTARQLSSSQARVRKLFPSFTTTQVTEFIQSLGTDVRSRLTHLEGEYEALDKTLKVWAKAYAPRRAFTAFDREGGAAGRIANEIRRCWRRETGNSLKLSYGQQTHPLPALSASFSHVERLDIHGFKWSEQGDTFLKNFTHLKRLYIEAQLTELPSAVSDMPGLTRLSLPSNQIRLTAQSAAKLCALGGLEELNLSGNPLGVPLDFSAMAGLKKLNLSFTQMEQWPTGLHNQTALEVIDLSHNRLREVPQANLNPPADQVEAIARLNRVTMLGHNLFPADYWQTFDGYWKRLGETRTDLLVGTRSGAFDSGNPRVKTVQKMFPAYDAQQAREYVWNLGEGAEVELARMSREFDVLQNQLNAWVFSGGGERQQYIRPGQRPMTVESFNHRFEASNSILRCWRRETPQVQARDGTPIGLELNLGHFALPSLPDLGVDFSHVGSLKLNGMGLTTSPEGFLARFRGVRWLDLSGNRLLELPPALGEMHGLTRLNLANNRIRLSPETARIVSERVTLRSLLLQGNRLLTCPDFSRLTDLRVLSLQNNGLDTWPTGLAEQPLLEYVNLSGNALTTIPETVISPPDERLAQTTRINNVTDASSNPWSDVTLQQVTAYGARLERAGLASSNRPNALVATVPRRTIRVVSPLANDPPFRRWTAELSSEQVAARRTQWNDLRGQAGSDGFFSVLRDLQAAGADHGDLQRRVWEVIDSTTANSEESENLRQQMFEWAGRPACCDRAALSFSNLEIMAMVYKARLQAMDSTKGEALRTLSKGMFRLDEVEKVALNDIDQRRTTINNDPSLSAPQKARRLALLEEVEIKLAYRYGLKDRLQLPGQPSQVRFTLLGNVSDAMIDAAYDKIIALDNSPEEFQALLSREFWQDYVTQKYRPRFEAQSKPYQEALAALHERYTDGSLTASAYDTQARDLQARLVIEDAALIDTLSRQEIAEQLLPREPLTASVVKTESTAAP